MATEFPDGWLEEGEIIGDSVPESCSKENLHQEGDAMTVTQHERDLSTVLRQSLKEKREAEARVQQLERQVRTLKGMEPWLNKLQAEFEEIAAATKRITHPDPSNLGGPESVVAVQMPSGYWLMLQAYIRNLLEARAALKESEQDEHESCSS